MTSMRTTRMASSRPTAFLMTLAATLLLLLLAHTHTVTAQAADNDTTISSHDGSAGSASGDSNDTTVFATCNIDVLDSIAGNTTCRVAPALVPLTDALANDACASSDCGAYVTRLSNSSIGNCTLLSNASLRHAYLEPLATRCNFTLVTNSSLSTGLFNQTNEFGPIDSGGNSTAPASNNDTSFSTIAIVLLVVGSVAGGGFVTVVVVWLLSQRRKRLAAAALVDSASAVDATPSRNKHQQLLTPSTALEDSSGHHHHDDVDVDHAASNECSGVGLTTAMQMHWTRASVLSSLTTTTANSIWDDDVIVAARIPRDKVAVAALVSRGGFGEVYRGTFNRQAVAIKTLLPEKRKHMRQIVAFLHEVKLMATLEHPQIVPFVGVAWDALSDVCVLSEFQAGGDLRALLQRFEVQEQRPHGLFDVDKVRIALHVAQALTYLHSLQPAIVHRDLKSKNILLDEQLNAKVADFGVSRERSDTTTMTAGVGTSLWMAPEVMLGERYDEAADMFSFGVVLSELDSQALPYAAHVQSNARASSSEQRRMPVLQMVSLGRLCVAFSKDVPLALRTLGDACVSIDPTARPTAAQAMCTLHTVLQKMLVQQQQ